MDEKTLKTLELMDISIKAIDGKFNKGYAEKHPELIAGFMTAYAIIDLTTEMEAILPPAPR